MGRMKESASDREYHAAQAMGLAQRLGRDEKETILGIIEAMDTYGTTDAPGVERMSDQSFWMWMCNEHGDDVIAWSASLNDLDEDQRKTTTAELRNRFKGEFIRAAGQS